MARHRMSLECAPFAETAGLRADLAEVKAQLRAARSALDDERDRAAQLITTIRSIVSQSPASGGPADTIADHFAARLDVLARYHRHPRESHDLEMLIRDELREFQFGWDPRITIGGQITWVQPAQAQALALAFHELIINALKFGALSHPGGKLQIAWVVATSELRLDWTETGGAVEQNVAHHHGFGRELIEQALPDQLGARTHFALRADGLHCRIGLPLGSRHAFTHRIVANILSQSTALQ